MTVILVPDDDTTRARIVEAFAWAAGIHAADLPRINDAARRVYERQAGTALVALRMLSVGHRDDITAASVEALLARAEKAEADRAWDREQHARELVAREEQARARWEASIAAQDTLRAIGQKVIAAHRARRKTVRVADLLDGLEGLS